MADIQIADFSGFNAEMVQDVNIGGVVKVAVLQDKRFTKLWPVKADVTGGEVTQAPVLVSGAKFAVWDCPENSIQFTDQLINDQGFQSWQHGVELLIAGQKKETVNELIKLVNSRVVFLFQDPTGQWFVAGQGQNGISITTSATTAKTGTDKRG